MKNIFAMKSFVLDKARSCVAYSGIDCLLDKEMQYGIIAEALHELIEFGKENYAKEQKIKYESSKLNNEIYEEAKYQMAEQYPELYSEPLAYNLTLIAEQPQLLEEMLKNIKFFYNNFGKKKYDTNMSNNEKKQILQNTMTAFSKEFQLLKDEIDYDEYEKFIQNNIESRSAKKATTGKSKFEHLSIDFILASMERKISDENELKLVLSSLVSIDANFYIKYENINIYPVILDLLVDTVSVDYQFYLDKELIQSIIREWKNAKTAQNLRTFFSNLQFFKMEWVEQITYPRSRSYLLHEYINILEQDPKKVQNFFQNILYNTKENSKHTPRLPPKHFDKIVPRRFFLQNTKMVLGKR